MHCYIHPDKWSNDHIELDPDEAHHLARVLRARPGKRIKIFDGIGHQGSALVTSCSSKQAEIEIQERHQVAPPSIKTILLQALPREQKWEIILQKATELGVWAITPLATKHCVARIHKSQIANKQERWEKIVLNAAKQSGNPYIPLINPIASIEDALKKEIIADHLIAGALTPGAKSLKSVLQELRSTMTEGTIAIMIGPEGDFSQDEWNLIRRKHVQLTSFGTNVLRAETAAIFALSALNYEFMEE